MHTEEQSDMYRPIVQALDTVQIVDLVNLTGQPLRIFDTEDLFWSRERQFFGLRRPRVKPVLDLPSEIICPGLHEHTPHRDTIEVQGVRLNVARTVQDSRMVVNMPFPRPGVHYVVTEPVARERKDRRDVYYPGTEVRNDEGHIIGYTELRKF